MSLSVRDLISAVVVFVFSGAAFYVAGDYGTRAGMFPRLVSGIMMGAAVLLFIRGLFFRQPGTEVDQVAVRRMGVAIVLTLLYIIAIVPLGHITSSIIFMIATTYLLGMRQYLTIATVTVLFVFGLHSVFERVFRAPLPDELLLRLF